MKPRPRFSVSPWTLLVFSALLKITQAQCPSSNCSSNETVTFTTTTTTVTLESRPNCSLSINNQSPSINFTENGPITGLTPGTVYPIFLGCLNCCKEATTKPEVVRDLRVAEVTTSSISLMWTKPEGNSSSYRVQWTDGNGNYNENVTQTQKNITNLIPGVQYKMTVTAVAVDGSSGQSTAVSQYTKPQVVRNLTANKITTSSISLMWTKPEGNSSFFTIQWTNGTKNLNANVKETTINVTQLTAGVQYHFTVIAVAGDNATLGEAKTISLYTKPEVVRNLSVTEITTSSISLMWTKPEGNSSSYRVQWTDGNGNYNENVTQTQKNITNLIPGVQYKMTVTAVAGDGSTGQSTAVSQYTKPEVVRNLGVTEITTSSISLMWTKPEGNSSSYRVQWTDGNGNYNENVTQTQKNITNLIPGVQYKMTVTAVAGDGSTGQSTAVSQYTKPQVVRNLTANKITASSISLMWTKPEGNSSFFTVQWTNGTNNLNANVTETTINVTQLTAGVQYHFTVIAVAGDNATLGEAKTISLYTKPEVVRNLSVTEITASSISLMWAKPEGNSSFFTVQWTNGTNNLNANVTETTINVTQLTAGVQYHFAVIAVAGDNATLGEAKTISLYTKPEVVRNLRVTEFTTSSISLMWTKPEGNVSSYRVQWTDGIENYNDNVAQTQKNITNLTAGVQYKMTVTAVAGDGSTGQSTAVSQYTRPEKPVNIRITARGTNFLNIGWTLPAGRADNYVVNISNERKTLYSNITAVTTAVFTDLPPGRIFFITVTAVAGNFSAMSDQFSSATDPTPPGAIVFSQRTNSSLSLKWATPALMEDASNISYYITYQPVGGKLQNKNASANTCWTLSLVPKAVTNLSVEDVNTTTIRLKWLRQSDHKPSYTYLVYALLNATLVQNGSTETETYTFFNLTPGNFYSFKVLTVVEGVMSAVENTSGYTKPEAVTAIMAIGSTTSMSVSWTPAFGQVDSYAVQLFRGGQLVKKSPNLSTTTFKFPGLTPGVSYCAVVITKSGPYENNNSVCNATFPNPPGPITVTSQTVESINFTWPFPNGMDHNQYNFSVYSFKGSLISGKNWFLLDQLQSGSLYSIAVVTEGVLNYQSSAVTTENYTRPYPVTNLTQTQITTNSVTLMWEQPQSKPYYSYVVRTNNGSIVSSEVVSNKQKEVTGLLSGSNYSFTVTTRTPDGTEAAPGTVSYFTRPHGIRSLEPETLSTTAVRLIWAKPLEHKPDYTYWVGTTDCGSRNNIVAGEVAEISELPPGTNCTFCVVVRAANGIEGKAICTSQYTKPEAVQPSISSLGSNSSIQVSWTKPPGKVERYEVSLSSSSKVSLDSTSTYYEFKDLSAGRLYTAMVTTYSGPFNASSGFITNATFPNPPGPIEILSKTTSSIDIRWAEAPLMNGASFFYQLTKPSAQGEKYINTSKTSHTFDTLLSGTSYNFSVATVGAMGFESERVQIYMVNTRPFHVQNLMTSTNEETITVTWNKPDEYKESYRYYLTSQGSDGTMSNITIKDTTYTFIDLVPGSSYDFNVTTVTSDGTKGAPRGISKCTNASPVTNLTCTGPNTENAEILLSWTKPKGQYSGFQVTVDNSKNYSMNTCCNKTVSDLRHYTEYRLTVETQSCGLPSTPESRLCRTGITNPPISANYASLVKVSSKEYNKFTLQIDSNLLDNVNGPITDVGVLVTGTFSGDTSDSLKYVGKTYNQWKEKETSGYMATAVELQTQTRSGASYLNIVIGDETNWAGYTNGALDANGQYQFAIVLFTHLNFQNNLVNVQDSVFSVTNYYNAVILPQSPAVIGIAVGVTLGIFCILLIIFIGFVIYWKRSSKKESPDIQIHAMRAKVSVAVRLEDYEAYYKKQKADSNCGFAEEFEDLKLVGTAQSKIHAQMLENKPKNRYNNVLPYDSSRVKLSIIHGNPYDDYINANYMPGYESRKEYIAAQGPLPGTVSDFWRMIWEKNVLTLVMLTRCNEQGRVKCEQYWDHGTKHYENITVTTTSEIPLEDWTIRDFHIKNVKTAETRSIRHFHFTAWPDHGVPQTTELLISFRHLVREHMDQYSRHSPTVVHCSAGVGRTGTFIAIDRLIFQIERENIVDVYGIVHDQRMHRPLMVQTEDQYVFLNQCAMDIIRSRTGTNVDLIYQNTGALSIYENIDPKKGFPKKGDHNA
ncbi:receptor-type tyrosine-protein phosphatase eta [Etheostoma spectabile]|uniref:receptor-type tyrosine-protein phosphatase eta n=1 Tax=Etheostoma spectabile TaxID=54343 RepID=UPI0013AF205B|nr:receptor-type tyrosine-protein phosphatase eta-like [Etheostoma spectabile]